MALPATLESSDVSSCATVAPRDTRRARELALRPTEDYRKRLSMRRFASRSKPDVEAPFIVTTIIGPDREPYRLTTISWLEFRRARP